MPEEEEGLEGKMKSVLKMVSPCVYTSVWQGGEAVIFEV